MGAAKKKKKILLTNADQKFVSRDERGKVHVLKKMVKEVAKYENRLNDNIVW